MYQACAETVIFRPRARRYFVVASVLSVVRYWIKHDVKMLQHAMSTLLLLGRRLRTSLESWNFKAFM